MIIRTAIYFLILASAPLGCTKKAQDSATETTSNLYSCSGTVAAKGSRNFGMDILNQASGGSYTNDFAQLKSMGGTYQTLHLTWSSIEAAGSGTTSGILADPSSALQIFSTLASSDGVRLALTIRPVDATGKTVPTDLASTRFNTVDMKTRFKAMLDFVLTKIPKQNLVSIMIGNEIDNYNPGSDTNFWTDYGDFLSDVRVHMNTTHAGLPIGFTATFEGITDNTKTLALGYNSVAVMQTYSALVDAVGVTYYPLSPTFQMKSPTLVAEHFQEIVDFTTKPIHIQEIGSSTSSVTSSSEYNQAWFFCEVFKAWDTHLSRIPNMAQLRLNDVSRSDAESLAGPYGISNEAFIEYLRTLGLQTQTGQAKQGLTLIKSELQKRGF